MLLWEQAGRFFQDDDDWSISSGGLYEIDVSDLTPDEWEKFYRFAFGTYRHEYRIDGESVPVPATMAEILAVRNEVGITLALRLPEEIHVNCWFYSDDLLSMDILAMDMTTESRFCIVVDFMQGAGRLLGKPVTLTSEMSETTPILQYQPARDQVIYTFGGWT